MMDIENMQTLGLKDMHTTQVEALLMFIQGALSLAAMTHDAETIADVEQDADELVRLFGGNGVSVKFILD